MAVLEKTSRKPNFKKDLNDGKISEKDFIEWFTSKPQNVGKKIFDVSDIKEYQLIDIDFVIDNEYGDSLPELDIVLSERKRYKKIEVKSDGRALDTGNLPFEIISHGNFGWSIITKCDYVYCTFVERNTTNIIKRCMIDMKKWKEFVILNANRNNLKINQIKDENITDFLCKVEDMIECGILFFV